MKISTEIGSASKIVGEEKAVELCAKAGFDAWDFTMSSMCKYDKTAKKCLESGHPLAGQDYLKFARQLKRIGLENGIVCNQSHAPYPTYIPEIRSCLKRAIECTAEAGGKICVIHPQNHKGVQENAELFNELLPFAKDYGIKLATENMWKWDFEKDQSVFAACATSESFKEHLETVNSEYLVACLDIGHAEMRGSGSGAVQMIHALGPMLQAVHIHDNDRWRDYHQIPFSMDIDFSSVMKSLREIGYSGYLTLEAYNFLTAYNKDNVLQGLEKMAASARRLSDIYEEAEN